MARDTNTITMKEYWREVAAIAREAKKRARSEHQDIQDILHEMIDGHEWIIYTWANPYVLIHSRNEDALFDSMGETVAKSYSEIMQQMAYFALETDVQNEIGG